MRPLPDDQRAGGRIRGRKWQPQDPRMRLFQEASPVRSDWQDAVHMGRVTLQPISGRCFAFTFQGFGITGKNSTHLRFMQRNGQQSRQHIKRQVWPCAQPPVRVIRQGVDTCKPSTFTPIPVVFGRIFQGSFRKRQRSRCPSQKLRIRPDPSPTITGQIASHLQAAMSFGTWLKASNKTSVPAPWPVPFSDKIRRQSRAPGRPANSPIMCRVTECRRPPSAIWASI